MTLHIKKHSGKSLAALLLATPLLLAACADNGPWPMPTGYTYEHSQYQTPPGPEPVFKKWQHENGMSGQPVQPISTHLGDDTLSPADTSVSATATQTTASMPPAAPGSWDQAAHELVSRLIADLGRPAEAVWLQSDGVATDQSLEFEKALLAALQQDDIKLATGPGAPFTLRYSVGLEGGSTHLSITMMSGGHQAAQESGQYTISESAAAATTTTTTTTTSSMMTSPDAVPVPAVTPDMAPPSPPPADTGAVQPPLKLSQPDDRGGGANE